MSNAVATVSFLQGQAWAKAPDGSLRPLSVGSVLNDDEVLVTAQGAQVQLDFGNGEPIQVNGGLEVAMSRDFTNGTATDPDEAALNDASVQEALTVLEQGGDLLEELEETAAGQAGAGGSDSTHDFVQLTRIIEETDPQSFNYQGIGSGDVAAEQTDANNASYINRAPQVTDQTLAAIEDEPISGQVIASDIEGDSLTYSLNTPATNGVVTLDPVTGQFTFTPNANYNGSDSFVVTVTDSHGNTSTTTINLNIAAVNDAPTTNDINLTTDEDTPVAGQVVAQDIEGDTLTYTISGQPANGSVTLDPATGSFVYTPNANYNGGDSFIVTVSDGNGGTTTSTVRVGVTPVNDAPTSNDQNLVTNEDTPVNGQVVASDIDGDTLGYSVSGQPANGSVTLNPATGSFVYTPNANYNGSDSFVVTISDGNGGTTTSRINIGVTPVNDAPVSGNQNLTTAEDTPLNGQVVATDIENDVLTYTISGQPTNGSVTLNPATGGFVYTPNANYNGGDSFEVTISDGNGGATTSRINIGVTPVNDAPTSGNVNLTTPENTAVTGQVNASDVDGDSLTFALGSAPAHGTVTLNPATGGFIYTPAAGYNGSDSFVVSISDGNGGFTTSLVNIGVTPVNDVPVATNQSLTTNENVPINGAISATDADGDTLSYSISTSPANGTLVLNNTTGGFTYTPNNGYSGSDSFVVTVSDGNGGTTTSTISIGVTAVNHAPTASSDSATTDENTAVTVAVRSNDLDPDGDSLTVTGVTQGANGSVVIDVATGNPIYTPNAGFTGTDVFTYTISDGNGGTDTATVTVVVNAVIPPNNVPVAVADSITVAEGGMATTLTGGATSVLANDSDADGDPLTAVLVSGPVNGSLTLNPNGTFSYIHNGSETTTDSFTYKVNDGTADGNTVTVNITVTPVNDAPVAVADSIQVNEGGTATVLVSGATSVLANDSDAENDSLSAVLVSGPTNGTLTLNANGTFSYTHNGSETTTDSFTYRANDGTVNGNIVTVTINVTPVNDAPVANDDVATVNEGDSVVVAVRANDTDAEGDSLSVSGVTQGANGSVVIDAVTGNPIYTPNSGFTGTDSFTYTVRDPSGAISNTATVTVTVNPVNHAPIAVADTFTVAEGGTLTGAGANVLTNDSDPDGNPLTAILVTGPANGTLTLNANGQFTYIHNGSETTTDSFTYKVNDGSVDGNTVTVTINVTPVNDAPISIVDSIQVNEGGTATVLVSGATSVLANDSDAEGDTLTAILVSGPVNGTLTLNADGTFSYVHNGSETTTDSFSYRANDGTVNGNIVTVNITVTPVNDAPVANDDVVTVLENGTVTVAVRTNDTDAEGDPLTVNSVTQGAHGSVVIDAITGNPVYTPNNGFSGTDSFTYTVRDPSGAISNTATVTVTVSAINHAPVAVADTFTVAEGGTLSGAGANVLANDTDPDGNPLTAILVTGPTNGTLTLNANGTFSYVHNGSETTTDSFTYKVNDGTVDGNTVTVTINVTPVNDAPVAVADNYTVAEGGTLNGTSVLANDTDAEGDSLTAILVSGPAHGTLTLNADGTFTYIHDGSETTSDSFSYKVNDGTVDGNTVTVNIGVTPVNDAPETNPASATGDEDSLVAVTLSGSDVDGTVVGYLIKALPANGVLYHDAAKTLVISAGDLVSSPIYFMPNADWNGTTSFSFAARDNLGLEDPTPATATITINPLPDAAIIGGTTSGSVKEDTPAQTTASGTLTVTDPDAGEAAFTPKAGSPGTYGSFSIDATGNWTYVLDNGKPAVQALKEGETRLDTFSVTSLDGTSTTVTITVKGTNDGPVAVADTTSVNQDTALTLTPAQLLGNDFDIDGDTLTITSLQGEVNGSVRFVGGNVEFTPTAGYHGLASFTYTVNDGHGGTSTATVSVNVIKANTPPDAVDDAAAPTTGNLGLYSEYFGYREPADGPNLTSIEQIYTFINGRTPNATFIAKSFDYTGGTFADGLGYGTNLQTFLGSDAASLSTDPVSTSDAIIRMRGFVNLDPGSYNFKILADDGYQIRVDGVVVAEVNRIQQQTTATHAPFTIATGGLHHVEIIYWDQGGAAKLKVELSNNGGATYNLLSAVPTYQHTTLSAVEDTPLSIAASSLLANDTDADGDTLTIQSVQGAENGTVSLSGGSVIFTPFANYSGPASFTYTISDGKGGTDTAKVYLSVVPVNDAPVARPDSVLTKQNTAISIPLSTLLANDTDVENDYLSLVSVQGATNGSVAISGSNLIFTPTSNFEGYASFTYTIRDPAGATSTAAVTVTVGSATTPSLVVARSLVANAHGTGGTSVKFPIITKLVDTDGSESLTIKVSNVPTGLSFNAGVNLGGGVWQFTEADLPNLTLNLPGSYTTNATHLTVQVTSTEMYGGATASVSNVVTLKAAYTTVDITTTESGSYTGSSANEFIQGGSGDNTINASNGNNIVYGGAGNDNIIAGVGSDELYGGSGNDTINAGSGSDRISGGAGNDLLKGGDAGENFVDVFVWSLGDQGAAGTPAVDTIQNFATAAAGSNTTGGDVLDLRDLLQGESVGPSNGAGNLANYLHFEVSGSNTIIHISHTGGFGADSHSVGGSYTSSAETQQIILEGVNLQTTYSGATTDQQIITQLLNNNKLITD